MAQTQPADTGADGNHPIYSVRAPDHNSRLAGLPNLHAKVLHFGVKVQSFERFLDEYVCEIWQGNRVGRGGCYEQPLHINLHKPFGKMGE